MDPKATLELAIERWSDGDRDGTIELVVAYGQWRDKGGFEPLLGIEWGDSVVEWLRSLIHKFD